MSRTVNEATNAFQPPLSPTRKPVSAFSSAALAAGPASDTVIVDRAVRSARRRFLASSDARSASRRPSSFSNDTRSVIEVARVNNRRALSTRAR